MQKAKKAKILIMTFQCFYRMQWCEIMDPELMEPLWQFLAPPHRSPSGSAETLGFNRSFTFMCWIKIREFNISDQGDNAIIGQRECLPFSTLHLVIRNRRPHFGFYGSDTTGTTVLQEGTWYHICAIYDMSEGRQTILVNGIVDASTLHHEPLRANYQVYYSMYANARPLNGYLAVPRFWRNALSIEDVNQVMNIGTLGAFPQRLADLYRGTGLELFRPPADCLVDSTWDMLPHLHPPRPPPLKTQTILSSDELKSELSMMFNNEKFSDIVIKYQDKQLFGHRIVLSCRSSFFRAMLYSDMIESQTGVMVIEDLFDDDADAFEDFIKLLYTYDVSILTDLNRIILLLCYAVRFDTPKVMAMLECAASLYVAEHNVHDVMSSIEGMNCPQLAAFCTEYVSSMGASGIRDNTPFSNL